MNSLAFDHFHNTLFIYFYIISLSNECTLTCSSRKTKEFLHFLLNKSKTVFMNDCKQNIVSLIMQYCYTKHIDRVIKTIQ